MTRKRPLRELYAELNAQFWGGTLPAALPRSYGGPVTGEPLLRQFDDAGLLMATAHCDLGPRFVRLSSRRRASGARGFCRGRFTPPGECSPPAIHVLSLSPEEDRETLIHEMIHFALYRARVFARHGREFTAELERLAASGEAWAQKQADLYRKALWQDDWLRSGGKLRLDDEDVTYLLE